MTSAVALKEWAVVVEAMARGQQCLLLRKGGVADPEATFELAHREFFLFPTFEHQRREQVRGEFHLLFDQVAAHPPPADQVVLPLYAGVAGSWPMTAPEALCGLEHLHVWTPEFLATRLAYKPEIPTLALLVRAYRLPTPPIIPALPAYAGCKSWVPLTEPLPVAGAVPVLDNRRFRQLLETLSARLG